MSLQHEPMFPFLKAYVDAYGAPWKAGQAMPAAAREEAEEDALYRAWTLGDYVDRDCPNCGRHRLCACPNGKHRCEKCDWCPEDEAYAPVRW